MASQKDDILTLLDSPKVRPNLIAMLLVGIGLGYAIKIAVDQLRKPATPPASV